MEENKVLYSLDKKKRGFYMQFSLESLKQNSGYTAKNQVSVAKNNGALAAMKSGKLTANTSKDAISKKIDNYTAAVIDETTEIMKNTRTDIIFVIDKSSSTEGLEGATCAGYNALITKENKSGFQTRVTTVFFADDMETVNFRENVGSVRPLAYRAYGNTKLYDTLATAMKNVRESQVRDGVKVNNTLVYIMTDGGDNRSHEYDVNSIRDLIKEYMNSYGWEFLFLGALDNAQEVAADLGINYNNAVQIEKSQEGMYNSFISTSKALDDLRTYGKLTDSWADASKKKNIAIEDKNQKRLGLK